MRSVSNKISKSFNKLEYEKISKEPNRLKKSNQLNLPPPLLILDLNGSLIYRPNFKNGEKRPEPIIRPNLNEFFNYIFGKEINESKEYKNWEVMIWSSAQDKNVQIMCDLLGIEKRKSCEMNEIKKNLNFKLLNHRYLTRSKSSSLNKLNSLEIKFNQRFQIDQIQIQIDNHKNLKRKRSVLDIWDRSQMNLNHNDFNRKVLTIKDLNSIWKKIKYQDPYSEEKYSYGPKNTIIMDDSPEKLTLQPYNLCQINEFKGDLNDDGLLKIIQTLKQIKSQSNFSSYLRTIHDQNQNQNQIINN